MRARLVGRFTALRRSMRARLILDGTARVLGEVVGLALLSLLLDWWLRPSLGMRLACLALAVVVLIFESRRFILLPLKVNLNPLQLAALLDARGVNGHGPGGLSSRVATVLELPELLRSGGARSSAMVERAVRRCDAELRDVKLSAALDDRRHRLVLCGIALALIVPAIVALAMPRVAHLWFNRWLLASRQAWPQRTYLEVSGLSNGRIVIPRGEPFALRVAARPGSQTPSAINLRFRSADPHAGAATNALLTRFGPNDFRYQFPSVDDDLTIDVRGGDDVVDPFAVHVVDRPRVTTISLTSKHPTDAQASTHNFSGQEADFSFLPLTALRLAVASNVPVAEVHIGASTASTTRPTTQPDLKRIDERTFELSWIHRDAARFQIELVGRESGLVSPPTPVAIGLKKDQPPRVSLQYRGVRQRVTPQAQIPLTITAVDDYAVDTMDLAVKTETPDPADPAKMRADDTSTSLVRGASTQPSPLEIGQSQTFELAPRKLSPGVVLSLTGVASDACYTGAQTSRSRTAAFRLVAPEELFKEILLRQQGERAKFRKAVEEAQRIAEALHTFAAPEAAAPLAQRHRALQREVPRIATSLGESLTEMKLNRLGSVEAYELMERNILAPLKQLQSELMSPQAAALDALSKPDADQAHSVADAVARQDQMVSTMQQILKQMAQWDSFVDVLNQLNEIIRLQERVEQGTELLGKKQANELFEK
jgi:hypothetical protein